MCFIFKKNNRRTKKPVNRLLQDGASPGIRSLQTSIVIKLCETPGEWTLYGAPRFQFGTSEPDLHLNTEKHIYKASRV